MHVDEEVVQRVLHAELDPASQPGVEEHLAGCALCRERVDAARRDEVDAMRLLAALDVDMPRVTALQLIESGRARARDSAWIRWAAVIVLAVGIVGTAYAAPGSPLPRWVSAIIGDVSRKPRDVGSVGEPSHQAQREAQDRAASGIAMDADTALLVLFTSRQASGHARVSLTDAAEVTVRSFTPGVPFKSDVGRLVVENRGSTADFEVLIPRAAPRVEIRVGSERVYLKERDRITAPGVAGSGDSRVVPLGRSP